MCLVLKKRSRAQVEPVSLSVGLLRSGHVTNAVRVRTCPKVMVDVYSAVVSLSVSANARRPCSSLNIVMTSDPSDSWSPPEGTTTFTDTFSPSGHSYTGKCWCFCSASYSSLWSYRHPTIFLRRGRLCQLYATPCGVTDIISAKRQLRRCLYGRQFP